MFSAFAPLLAVCREGPLTNKYYGKWYKFNDTTVEEVEMTPQFMETELFGGKYYAKTDKSTYYCFFPSVCCSVRYSWPKRAV